ncbi:MAG: hypothetical protein M5U26_16710 [Planctomycetota bacterium]|nr:hypothetical protein [Planctomycetota bacterium]
MIVSTHTKNLQSQLFHKDLPILREALGVEFEAALLKGRPNYLCARKFMYTLQESVQELDEDERAALLPVMTWAARTEDGDVAELAAFSPEEHPELWDRLHTVGEDCMGRQCPFYHRCFVYRARGLARGADLVVCNHALVFADLNLENGSLPPHEEVVFDEAHTLEDVATEHLACEVTPRRVQRVLSRLFKAPQGSSAGKGLLPSILFQLEQAKSEFPEPLFADLREHVLLAIQAVEPAGEASEYAFDGLRAWFERRVERGEDDRPAPLHVPREPGRREPDDGGFAPASPSPPGPPSRAAATTAPACASPPRPSAATRKSCSRNPRNPPSPASAACARPSARSKRTSRRSSSAASAAPARCRRNWPPRIFSCRS